MRSITLYCELAQTAVLDGLQAELMASGTDIGSAEVAPEEPTIAEASAKAADVKPGDEVLSANVQADAAEETTTDTDPTEQASA